MQTISISGFVDNGKTEFSKAVVVSPCKLDATHKEKKYKMTININLDYVYGNAGKKYLYLDAPGHNVLLPHLISAINLADIHILVISCNFKDSGISNIGAYKQLYKDNRVTKLIVVLSKIDLVPKTIYYQLVEQIKNELHDFEIYFLPFSYKNPTISMALFKQYLDQFKNSSDNLPLILKTYNVNKTGCFVVTVST